MTLFDSDSEEQEKLIDCLNCAGMGGYDCAWDCEIYDDWKECVTCNGTGVISESEAEYD